jgi:acetyl esterase/lipase
MDYRLSTFLPCSGVPGLSTYPGAIQECKAAVDWIHRQGTQIFGLSDRVVVCGSSAGGHLAALLAVTQGTNETFFNPDPFGNYTVDRALVFSGINNLVKIGCVGNPWNTTCSALCPKAQGCRFLQGCLSTGGYPAGFPCSKENQNCRHFDAPESLLGELWPLVGAPQNVDCSAPQSVPGAIGSMPTGNPWYDASPYFWANGSEVPFHIYAGGCDALVPSYESIDLAERLAAFGVPTELVITEPERTCDAGCRHSLFLVLGVFDAADEIRELLLTTYGG